MKRRTLLGGFGASTLIATYPALAQRSPRRIGWISTDRAAGNTGYSAFQDGLRAAGYRIGVDLVIEERWGEGSFDALERLAPELVRTRPEVIVTQGPAMRYLIATKTDIPIVFGFSGDPVAAGYVESFARPGRNATGVSFLALDLVGKRMELLREAMPAMKRVAIAANPNHAGESSELRVSREAAARVGFDLEYFQVRNQAELDAALAGAVKARSEALMLFPDAGMMRYAEPIAAYSVRERIPAISGWSIFVRRGNVFSYGPNLEQGYGRLAYYVDRILRGARASDIPVELPTRVELAVNLRTAQAIGLPIPASVLQRADEVIRA